MMLAAKRLGEQNSLRWGNGEPGAAATRTIRADRDEVLGHILTGVDR
jgi:hypothetical protein